MAALNDFELDVDLEPGPDGGPDGEPDEELEDGIGSLNGRLRAHRFRSGRTPTAGSIVSRHSFTATPLRVIRRFTSSSQLAPDEAQKRPSYARVLIGVLSAGQPRDAPSFDATYLDACDWYATFIDSRCRAHWRAIQPVVVGVKRGALAPDADDIAKVDRVLATIAENLTTKKDFALVEIVDDLVNLGLIIDDGADERVALHRLMFTFLGWLTMLYDPSADYTQKMLQVAKFSLSTAGNKVDLHSRTFDTYAQDLEYIDQSLYLLLGRFGKLIPDLPLRRRSQVSPPSEWIVVPFVCYQTLRAVCRVEIEWVDTLGMHLEFDSSRKVLKIFRFPSFCRLMYKHKQRGLLSQLFDDKERDLRGEPRAESFFTSDYFCEMLLTYRLIFGQDAKSSRLFLKELAALTHTKPHSNSASKSKSKSRQPCVFALPETDPLLAKLCSRPCDTPEMADIYTALNAPNTQSYYTPSSYPFFAEKLLALQAYVKEQHPHDWKTLWHDHRNKSNWWQFWAVLFIGGGTLILGTLSLAFQIWQAVLTQQQLAQGQLGNSGAASPPARDI